MSRSNVDAKVYVGDLGSNASQTELEDAFSYYGPLNSVWVARNPPGFAFVEFEDPRDAKDAVRGLDGRTVCSRRISVEMSTGRSRNRGGGGGGAGRSRFDSGGDRRGGGSRGGNYSSNDRCYECGQSGHYAYDCPDKRPNKFSRRSRSRDRRSRSRSADRGGRKDRSRSRSISRSRSRSPAKNGRN